MSDPYRVFPGQTIAGVHVSTAWRPGDAVLCEFVCPCGCGQALQVWTQGGNIKVCLPGREEKVVSGGARGGE